ncbi:MAG TPA: hypothetical protein VFL95_03455 [Gemmatimonadales bacterium]|nr:hypothetical protein [Gemmatimonadales bacterium]
MSRWLCWVIGAQSLYYLVTGAWPWLSMRLFEAVTGPKVDDWLVRMVGLLIVAVGAALLTAVLRQELSAAVLVLAFGSAAAFLIVDLIYALAGRISPIYLADAAVELGLIILLALGGLHDRRSASAD